MSENCTNVDERTLLLENNRWRTNYAESTASGASIPATAVTLSDSSLFIFALCILAMSFMTFCTVLVALAAAQVTEEIIRRN